MRTLFEWALELQRYPFGRAERELQDLTRLSREELARWQEARRWEIVHWHVERNPLYRSLLRNGVPESWEALPIVTKRSFQRPLGEMITDGLRLDDLHVSSTSGSSGTPFFFARDKETHARSWALNRQRYAWQGIRFDSRQARFYGIPLDLPARFKEELKDRIMNRVRFPVFDLSDAMLERFVARFSRCRAEYVYGYTNSLVLFARYLLRTSRRLNVVASSLRRCITTSEVCLPEDRSLLAEAFGVPVVNEYGASEVGGIIAFEDADGEWRLSDENIYVEVVDESGQPVPDGETGQILITDLFNRAMPFLRYQIGDVGRIGPGEEGNRPQRVLRALDGRRNDTILLPSGRTSPGLTFYYISRRILERAGVLREFIIRQTAIDEFVFEVVADRSLESEEKESIQEQMDRYLEPGLKLRFHEVPAIRRQPSGKLKHFHSELRGGSEVSVS